MLAANIEDKVRRILEEKGGSGWLRVNECAREYSKDRVTKKENPSEKTKFYRWRRKVEKGQVKGFQVVKLPGNTSFIGLDEADPGEIESFISQDRKAKRSVKSGFGFFEWLRYRSEMKKQKEKERERIRLAEFYAEAEFLAEKFPEAGFDALKDYADFLRRKRKQAGLE